MYQLGQSKSRRFYTSFLWILSSSVILNWTCKVASCLFACAAIGKITKLKRYAKPFHRLIQRPVKRVVIGKWTTSCKNTLQKSNVYLWLCSTKSFCIRRSLFFKTSGSTRLTSLSLAKFWIPVLNFNVFWPKSLNCIVFNVEIVKLGTQADFFRAGEIFPTKSGNKSF